MRKRNSCGRGSPDNWAIYRIYGAIPTIPPHSARRPSTHCNQKRRDRKQLTIQQTTTQERNQRKELLWRNPYTRKETSRCIRTMPIACKSIYSFCHCGAKKERKSTSRVPPVLGVAWLDSTGRERLIAVLRTEIG